LPAKETRPGGRHRKDARRPPKRSGVRCGGRGCILARPQPPARVVDPCVRRPTAPALETVYASLTPDERQRLVEEARAGDVLGRLLLKCEFLYSNRQTVTGEVGTLAQVSSSSRASASTRSCAQGLPRCRREAVELPRHLLRPHRRPHRHEESVRLAELALAGGLVAEEMR